jgi:hypothetical protein
MSEMSAAQHAAFDPWRGWIAENLLLGADDASIVAAMVAHGIDAGTAGAEVAVARASPYLAVARRLQARVRKRDWILDVRRKLDRMRAGTAVVERVPTLSRDAFFDEYYLKNRPVVIEGALAHWPAMQRWSFDAFRARLGEREVEVQFGRESDPDFEVNQPRHRRRMRFAEYLDLVERSGPTNDFYMTANNSGHNRAALAELWDDVPVLDTYLDPASPDRGFFWLGPRGTKTPFHHDLTNNFMAQVIGSKLVRLVAPEDTPYLYNHLHCYAQVDGQRIDLERFPLMREARLIDVVIHPGDLLFLPIGWWHYVEGLQATVTMTYINFRLDNDFSSFYSTYHEV